MTDAAFAAFRAKTGLVRPPASHGCPPTEILPGLWTAHFHEIEDEAQLKKAAPAVTCVVNAGCDKCPTQPGAYGDAVTLVRIEGLLDDPDAMKKVDAMPEGPEKVAARAALPAYTAEECAGDAKKDFERVNKIIADTRAAGGATLVHCHASLSRSVAFILAFIMKEQGCTACEAVDVMKPKWDATWPNNTFTKQLLEYEAELKAAK